jgi:hypothetical protein
MEKDTYSPYNINSVVIASDEEKGMIIFLGEDRRIELTEDGKYMAHDFFVPEQLAKFKKEKGNGIVISLSNSSMHGLPSNEESDGILHEVFFIRTVFLKNMQSDDIMSVEEFLKNIKIAELVEQLMDDWELEVAMGTDNENSSK